MYLRESKTMSDGMPKRVWVEMQDASDRDACDVIVEMEDRTYFTAMFVTLPYLSRQMALTYEVSKQFPDSPAVRYAPMDTPHVLVDNLDWDTIEDTVDSLLALDTFDSLFTPVLPEIDDTAEVAAVVMNEVLIVETDTVA